MQAEKAPAHVEMSTGTRIRFLMADRGRKPDEFAAVLKIGRMSIWRYMYDVPNRKGFPPDIPSRVLNQMANELGTTTDFLLGRTPDPRPVGDTRV